MPDVSPSLYIRQLPENRIHPGLLLVDVAKVLTVKAAVFFEYDTDSFRPLNDDNTPEAIYRALRISKRTFNKAMGMLYKRRGRAIWIARMEFI